MQIVEFLNEFHITTGFGRFKDKEKDMIKNLHYPDGNKAYRWNNEKKVWIVPISFKEKVYHIGRTCRASHIQIKDNLPERVDTIPALPKLDIAIPLKKGAMRNYQEEGVARGLQLKRFINGDQPGLGKTLQSIATLAGAEIKGDITFPVLVICPSALKINWSREFEMWTDKKAIVLHDGIKDTWQRWWEMDLADVFIVNYESMKKYFVTDMPTKKNLSHSSQIIMDPRVNMFKSVIIDESHRLKDPNSITAKICINVTKNKEYIILLTGTPVVNKPVDLFSQLAVMFKLNHFGGANGFKQRYCEGGRGAANLAELNYLLNVTCFFQRKKEDVLKDLPALTRQTIICSITNRSEFDKVKNDFVNFLKKSDLTDAEIKKKVNAEVIVKITMLLQLSAIGKIEAAQEYIDEVVGAGLKIIIGVKHQIIVDSLMKLYPKAVCVTGRQNAIQKQVAVDGFQTNPGINIIIVNYKAGGVGITLTAASELLLLELPWTQADVEQFEARAHRMGQPSGVRSTSLLGENTLDQWMYNIIQEKKVIANAVTGNEDDIPVSMISKVIDLFK
ncbi:MAG TPA: DEAD/DEAH box helicase [Flavobacterium sp.]|jgi:SWI/SNF-related matrix-associated actin-dependent regulator 1 of chromatin subfamily A